MVGDRQHELAARLRQVTNQHERSSPVGGRAPRQVARLALNDSLVLEEALRTLSGSVEVFGLAEEPARPASL